MMVFSNSASVLSEMMRFKFKKAKAVTFILEDKNDELLNKTKVAKILGKELSKVL